MKRQIMFSVRNVDNSHVHFERIVESDTNVSIPYDKIIPALEYLFQGLKSKVCIEIVSY